ncbi:hypothetical protein, partial [Xanthomonas oryzae]
MALIEQAGRADKALYLTSDGRVGSAVLPYSVIMQNSAFRSLKNVIFVKFPNYIAIHLLHTRYASAEHQARHWRNATTAVCDGLSWRCCLCDQNVYAVRNPANCPNLHA